MFGSDVLDVAIGLVLVFLMMSIIMTAVQEALEGWFKTRATHLENSLLEIFQGDKTALESFYGHPLIFALYRGGSPMGPGKGPTYIPREAFSAALIDMVEHGGDSLPAPLKRAYDGLKRVAADDTAQVRHEVEGWYDGAMDRASGWFKRRTQRNLFVMGLIAAIGLNINAVAIAQFLHANHSERGLMEKVAEGLPKEGTFTDDQRKGFETAVFQAGLPLGWNASSRAWTFREIFPPKPDTTGGFAIVMGVVGLLVGYVMTALATMLGAPFWFDILNRIMVIRSTVKPREKSPDEDPEGSKS